MTRFLLLSIALFLTTTVISQNTNLSGYSYVIVPEQYGFLKGNDQYQMNSMTKFYLEKSGFNAYMANDAPNANRCDGLYANVEELRTILGTKVQIVLKDCYNSEIYRSEEGKSKYKEYDKSYQDALRKAFKSVEALNVNQKDITLFNDTVNNAAVSNEVKTNPDVVAPDRTKVSNVAGTILPDSKFSNYSHNGKTFLLRKTAEGYSLYEESAGSEDGLLLKGKIIVMDKVVKYMDTSGKVSDATFDASGNLTVKDDSATTIYKTEN
ncbi:MAG TPA: hypothetical protein VFM72_02715 [Aequorivita sp.]|nr:hypothetical protein [Aequorivita sp.]